MFIVMQKENNKRKKKKWRLNSLRYPNTDMLLYCSVKNFTEYLLEFFCKERFIMFSSTRIYSDLPTIRGWKMCLILGWIFTFLCFKLIVLSLCMSISDEIEIEAIAVDETMTVGII